MRAPSSKRRRWLATGLAIVVPSVAALFVPPSARAQGAPAVASASASASASSAARRPPAWEPLGEDDGVAVFRREVQGSRVIAFRGTGVIDAPLVKVATVLFDVDRAHEWVASLVEARRVRVSSPLDLVEWDHFATPFVMKDRDFVYRNELRVLPDGRSVVLAAHSVADAGAPETSYVRGEILESSAVLTPLEGGARTRIEVEVHCDPKGSVAKWIVNWVQKDWPHDTITRLRAQTRRADVRESAELARALEAAGLRR